MEHEACLTRADDRRTSLPAERTSGSSGTCADRRLSASGLPLPVNRLADTSTTTGRDHEIPLEGGITTRRMKMFVRGYFHD